MGDHKRIKVATGTEALGLLRVASCDSNSALESCNQTQVGARDAGDTESGAEALMALLSRRPVGDDAMIIPSDTNREPGDSRNGKQRDNFEDASSRPNKQCKRKRKEKDEAAPIVLAEGEPVLHELPPDGAPWVNLNVTLRSGKYKGRRAVVLGLAKKKYRVQVEGLDYQLEFYPSYVGLPTPPEGYQCAPPNNASTSSMQNEVP